MEDLKRKLIEKLRPSLEERVEVERIVRQVEEKAWEEADRIGVEVEVSVEGSIAKDTWISGDRDIDIFIKLPRSLGREGIKDIGIKIARATAGPEYLESYAEHPYVQAFVKGYRVDIVPCLKLERLEGEVTAVDRTPFHTAFVKARLSEEGRDEVRLLKGFMKGIGVYGAEVKVQGFSGYLCELLILYYGGFNQLLKAASAWKPMEVFLDLAKLYLSVKEAQELFNSSLVVIDPVDARRNVAAALSIQKMAEFISASRLFLASPSEYFFFPPPLKEIGDKDLEKILKSRGTHLLALEIEVSREPADILWSQLYKSLEGMEKLLTNAGFEVVDKCVWSDERKKAIFTLELDHLTIPTIRKQHGPPLDRVPDGERFLKKHLGRDVKGPSVEGWRWVAYTSRKLVDASRLLKERVLTAKLGKIVKDGLRKGAKTCVDLELIELMHGFRGYGEFLTEFLDGRPRWLRAYLHSLRQD